MEYQIKYGMSLESYDIDGYEEADHEVIQVRLGRTQHEHEMTKFEIDFIKKVLPGLLKEGESLDLTTHVDHDDYFMVEVMRNEWPAEKYCDVRVLSYSNGCMWGGYSDWVDLNNEDEIQEFVDGIFDGGR